MVMNFRIGNPAIVEQLNIEQLKAYWQELKLSRYDSHFYLMLLEKIKLLNPNLVFPPESEIEKIKNEALNLALWEENWEVKNRERVKNGGVDYSLFNQKDNIRKIDENPNKNLSVNR